MRVSMFLPVALAVVFRTQLAPCSELPPAPPDPTEYPTTMVMPEEERDFGKGKGRMDDDDENRLPPQLLDGFYVPPDWPPNYALGFDRSWGMGSQPGPEEVGKGGRHPFPYDTVFTEYDYFVNQAGKGDPFKSSRVETATLEQCKVTGDLLHHTPWLKVAVRGCELADGALALHAKTIELQLVDCRSPLTAATLTPWVYPEKALDAAFQKAEPVYERGLLPDVESYLPPDDADRHRGRDVKIDNCPLANDPDLFPVLWRSLCDFTHYDPRPDFDGILYRGAQACPGPFGGATPATLLLAAMELSVAQLEAAIGAMRPGQRLRLSSVALTGAPSANLLAALRDKTTWPQFVEYPATREWGLHIEWTNGEHPTVPTVPSTADGFELFRACVRGAAPHCALTEAKRTELEAEGRRYVPWLSQKNPMRMATEPDEEPRAEFTFAVTISAPTRRDVLLNLRTSRLAATAPAP